MGLVEGFIELVAEEFISRDAAGEKNRFGLGMELGGFFELFNNDIDSGFLEAGGEVGNLLVG